MQRLLIIVLLQQAQVVTPVNSDVILVYPVKQFGVPFA
jgi:hypothetical protein